MSSANARWQIEGGASTRPRRRQAGKAQRPRHKLTFRGFSQKHPSRFFTRRFAESDCALMQSHNLTANARTQSGATRSPASGVVGAIKRFKQMGSVLRGNFWTGVSHCYYRKACLETYMEADPAIRVIILKGIV